MSFYDSPINCENMFFDIAKPISLLYNFSNTSSHPLFREGNGEMYSVALYGLNEEKFAFIHLNIDTLFGRLQFVFRGA
jgi:hypothetical protein